MREAVILKLGVGPGAVVVTHFLELLSSSDISARALYRRMIYGPPQKCLLGFLETNRLLLTLVYSKRTISNLSHTVSFREKNKNKRNPWKRPSVTLFKMCIFAFIVDDTLFLKYPATAACCSRTQ